MGIVEGEYLFIDKTTGIHVIARCYEGFFGARSPIFTRAQAEAIADDFNNDFEITGEMVFRYRDDWALVNVNDKEVTGISVDIADFFDFEYMHDDAGEDDRWGINVEGLIEYITEG